MGDSRPDAGAPANQNQKHSEALRSTQKQSEAIRSTQEAIRSNHKQSEAVRSDQKQSEVHLRERISRLRSGLGSGTTAFPGGSRHGRRRGRGRGSRCSSTGGWLGVGIGFGRGSDVGLGLGGGLRSCSGRRRHAPPKLHREGEVLVGHWGAWESMGEYGRSCGRSCGGSCWRSCGSSCEIVWERASSHLKEVGPVHVRRLEVHRERLEHRSLPKDLVVEQHLRARASSCEIMRDRGRPSKSHFARARRLQKESEGIRGIWRESEGVGGNQRESSPARSSSRAASPCAGRRAACAARHARAEAPALEIGGDRGRSWESVPLVTREPKRLRSRSWEIMGDFGRSWEIVGEHASDGTQVATACSPPRACSA